MKWTVKRPSWKSNAVKRRTARAFTLVELLAAMVFMAIVIPVAVQGLQIANRAGVVGQRKTVATRVLDTVLNEYLASAQKTSSRLQGTVQEGAVSYDWNIRLDTWREDNMRLVTAEVTYPVQGRSYKIHASTLVGLTTQ